MLLISTAVHRLLRMGRVAALLAVAGGLVSMCATASAQTTNQYVSQIDRSASQQAAVSPAGLAVSAAGDTYVSTSSGEVEHYGPSGDYAGLFEESVTPQGAVGFANAVAVAAGGDVYVVDASSGLVDRFDSSGAYVSQFDGSATPQGFFVPQFVAVGPDGHVFVNDGANGVVDEFDDTGAYVSQFGGSATPQGFFCVAALTVDPSGHVYVADPCSGTVDEFDASGAYVSQIDGGARLQGPYAPSAPVGLAAGANGHLYVGDGVNGVVDEYDAAGAYVAQFDGSLTPQGSFPPQNPAGVVNPLLIAAGPSGQISVADGRTTGWVDRFTEARVVAPDVTTSDAPALDQTTATLAGIVNPDGVAVSDCHFEYVDDTTFQASGFTGATAAACAPSPGSGTTDEPVTADLTGLTRNTTYHYRLVATNANATTHGHEQTFTTLAPPTVTLQPPTNNQPTSIDLNATINPNGNDTTYHFEYGADTSYGTSAPVPDADIGSDRGDQSVTVHLTGLTQATTYHYRVIAQNGIGSPTVGPDHTFITAGGAFPLPDQREWEQVTPVDKHGVNIPENGIAGVTADGNTVAFALNAGIAGTQVSRGLNDYVARRTSTGWVTSPLTLPSALSPGGQLAPLTISSDFTKALFIGQVETPGAPPANQGATNGSMRLYLETLSSDPHASPTYAVASPDVPAGPSIYALGGAPDLSTVVFQATNSFGPAGLPGVYEIVDTARGADATVRRVDIDNDGTPLTAGGSGASLTEQFNSVSQDGSRVFFVDNAHKHLYARTDGETTTAISDPSPSQCDPCVDPTVRGVLFAGASEDGNTAYFTTTQELVPGDNDATTDLYAYDFSAATGRHVSQVSEGGPGDATPGSGANVVGMVRLSDDGSHAAFVATGVLTTAPNASGDHAVTGADNLYYVRRAPDPAHPGSYVATTKFVGTVTADDSALWQEGDSLHPAQASSIDGRYLVFSTHAALTSDDTNTVADIYRYDDQTGSLVLISHGHDGYVDHGAPAVDATVAAPSFVASGGSLGAQVQSGRPRAIADDGSTILFSTKGSLDPADQNGKLNVYEWHDGDVTLIGDPQDPTNTTTTTAGGRGVLSRSGNDAFVLTGSALVPQDTDTTVRDIYDARVGGGFPFIPKSMCDLQADGCQPPSVLPPPPVLASAVSGPGGSRAAPAPSFSVTKPSAAQLRKLAATGRLVLSVTASESSTVRANAKATIKRKVATVASAQRTLTHAGTTSLALTLSKGARAQLAADGRLKVTIVVSDSKVSVTHSTTLKLTRAKPKAKKRTATIDRGARS